MKRRRDTDNWTTDNIETAAIAEMLHTLLFLEDGEKTTGVFPRNRIVAKLRSIFKKGKELFCQKLRWYTYKRVIYHSVPYLFLAEKVGTKRKKKKGMIDKKRVKRGETEKEDWRMWFETQSKPRFTNSEERES